MKKHQATKHRKQRKKELANRKAKQEQRRIAEEHMFPRPDKPEHYGYINIPKPDAPPMSPARRAFQNL